MSRIRDSVRFKRAQKQQSQKAPPGPKKKMTITPPEREKIVQMKISGKTYREIAKETGRGRHTIAKIISEADMPKYVEELREKFRALGNRALKTVGKKIDKDAEFAYQFLLDIGVVPRGDTVPIKAPQQTLLPALGDQARDQLLAAMSESDRIKFRLLTIAQVRNEAYQSVVEPRFLE